MKAMKMFLMLAVGLVPAFSASALAEWTTGPYANNENRSQALEVPGAADLIISVVGATEPGYDFIYIYDNQGKEVKRLDGNINAQFEVPGASIIAKLTSDGSITAAGVTVSIKKVEKMNYVSKAVFINDQSNLLVDNNWVKMSLGYPDPSSNRRILRIENKTNPSTTVCLRYVVSKGQQPPSGGCLGGGYYIDIDFPSLMESHMVDIRASTYSMFTYPRQDLVMVFNGVEFAEISGILSYTEMVP